MDTGILHTHHLIVVIYTLFVLFNFIIVLSKRRNALLTIKARTRTLRVVFEISLLGTGLYLMIKSPEGFSSYIFAKWIAIILGIVFFIIGTKKMNVFVMFLSVLLFIYTYFLGKTRNLLLKPEEMRIHEAYLSGPDELSKGKAIYDIACLRCHGEDGKAGYRKAKNLVNSQLSDDAIAGYIKMGRGIMPSYSYMKEEEIQVLVKYINQIRDLDKK